MTNLRTAAITRAQHGWPVFPLTGKIPAIPARAGGRGVLDATTDIAVVTAWWSGRYARANIGGRVPDAMIVIDVDPRHGGLDTITELQQRHGPLPPTLTTISGRGDGGRHLFYRRPSGQLSSRRLGAGIDLKTSSGYVVLPPSIHPDSGQPYTEIEAPVAAPPDWLTALLTPPIAAPTRTETPHRDAQFHGPSIADEYCANTSWSDILTPHGWRCLTADPDADGAKWLHPTATSACSATVRSGCLFVYSPNTPFDITETSHPKGYTRFRAYALLEHHGDLSVAAKTLTGKVVS